MRSNLDYCGLWVGERIKRRSLKEIELARPKHGVTLLLATEYAIILLLTLNINSHLDKPGLDPHPVHDLLVFAVDDHPAKVLVLHHPETSLCEQFLYLLQGEVVSASLVDSSVKIILDF